jgi:hypothetical protein
LTRPEHAIAIAEHKAKDLQEQANAHRTLSTSLAHDEAVINQQLTHSGDSRLARHIGKAVLREEARGAQLAKERKDSLGGSTPRWPP